MMELSMHTSRVIEFTKSGVNFPVPKQTNFYVDSSTATDIAVQIKHVGIQTQDKCEKSIQTEQEILFKWTAAELQIANESLKILAPRMEAALLEGSTPLPLNLHWSPASSQLVRVQTYQKLAVVSKNNSKQIKALSCWLAVYTNNAPALVVSTIATHDNWCEHMEQTLQLFVPKRDLRSDFVHFQLIKSLPLKACVQFLCTNNFDKSIFAASLYDSYIYVWQHQINKNELVQLHNQVVTEHGVALSLSWAASDILLSAHATGFVLRWRLAHKMTLEGIFAIRLHEDQPLEQLSTVMCITPYDFVVGTKEGCVYHCRQQTTKQTLDINTFHKHVFAVTQLNKSLHGGGVVITSCDLSGEVIVHDLFHPEDEHLLLPLPFKNCLSSPQSKELKMLFAPGIDGGLECFNIEARMHSTVKGALLGGGPGNFISCSENGSWIVSGLYGNDLQIFYVEQ